MKDKGFPFVAMKYLDSLTEECIAMSYSCRDIRADMRYGKRVEVIPAC